uniref:Uncharacterized protein n=1 Tax=Myotis myotis TaxID=51298 RepID=A0A7J7RUR8_MYOMY|nr:hypothetical protein mMyoMyo1_010150 [Myotis myotis]
MHTHAHARTCTHTHMHTHTRHLLFSVVLAVTELRKDNSCQQRVSFFALEVKLTSPRGQAASSASRNSSRDKSTPSCFQNLGSQPRTDSQASIPFKLCRPNVLRSRRKTSNNHPPGCVLSG